VQETIPASLFSVAPRTTDRRIELALSMRRAARMPVSGATGWEIVQHFLA
jgi:hypothetical protein